MPYGYNPQGQPSRPKILIIDDNEPTVRALSVLLGSAGYETIIALRGVDGLDNAQAGDISGAIVDIHLPDINGLVVSQKLRQILGPEVPILMLSGDTSMQMLNSLPHVGATYFFSKPINASQLLERVRHYVPLGAGGISLE